MQKETVALGFTALVLFYGTKLVSKFATWATRNVKRTEVAYYVVGSALTWGILLFGVLMLSSCATTQKPYATSFKIEQDVVNGLIFLYDNMPVEFGYCMYGKEVERTLIVERFEMADVTIENDMFLATDSSVVARCRRQPQAFMGIGHSHPKKWGDSGEQCKFSPKDVTAFITRKHRYTYIICYDKRSSSPYRIHVLNRDEALGVYQQQMHVRNTPK